VLLHDGQELDDDLGGGADEHLALSPLLRVEHVLQRIVQDTDSHHGSDWGSLPTPKAATGARSAGCGARESKGSASCCLALL
jgi:hypothetical protein